MSTQTSLPLKCYTACDHAGLDLKNKIIQSFSFIEWIDLGTKDSASVDYPDYADKVAAALKKDAGAFGLLVCGSGQGMAIRANRHPHIRAALCWKEEVASMARAHNNANVLCLGGRLIEPALALNIFNAFLKTPFEGDRHARRVEKLSREC